MCVRLRRRTKPRYLMGVGTPSNLIEGVARGIDFFDCVMPARNARHGHVFTWQGIRNLNNEKYARDEQPIEPGAAVRPAGIIRGLTCGICSGRANRCPDGLQRCTICIFITIWRA